MELADNPNIHTVTQLNNRVKSYIEKKYNNIYVNGEIASFQEYPSGHTYFILKDSLSEISCILFSSQKKKTFNIQLGMQLIIEGNVSLYQAKGKYQFIVNNLYQSGIGLSMKDFDKLKKKLNDEGLFLDKHKKIIPKYPSRIGLISSLKGAVVQDVIKVFNKKAPNIELFIIDTQVQGVNSVNDIINSIKDFNDYRNIDTILLCRGGGSMEDMQPFNDENVARAIFKSKIPIISGIGHEGDFTISDLVSDFRASTPTAASEKAIYDLNDLIQKLYLYNQKLNFIINNKMDFLKSKIKFIRNSKGFLNLDFKILHYKNILKQNKKEISIYSINRMKFYKNKIKLFSSSLKNLNPENIINKGYAILKTNNDKIITSGDNIFIGQKINIKMKNYIFKSEINDKVRNEKK